jgi:hypothetical protein
VSGGGETLDGFAGEDIDAEQGVYYDETTDEWFLVESGTPPFTGLWGIAEDDAATGKSLSIHYRGLISVESPGNFSAGTAIYIDSTTSALTTTSTGNEQIGVAKTDGVTGEDFMLDVNNATSGGSSGVEETLASNTLEYFNNLSTTSVEIDFGAAVVGIEVINDHASNNVAVRFDATDAVIPTVGSSLNEESLVRPKEKRFFGVTAQVINIIASAASTPVRVTGWLA